MRAGVGGDPQEYLTEDLPPSMVAKWQEALDALQALGPDVVTVQPVSLPHTAAALPAYYVISSAEAASNLARYDGIRYGRLISEARTTLIVLLRRVTLNHGRPRTAYGAPWIGARTRRRVWAGDAAADLDGHLRPLRTVRFLLPAPCTLLPPPCTNTAADVILTG